MCINIVLVLSEVIDYDVCRSIVKIPLITDAQSYLVEQLEAKHFVK